MVGINFMHAEKIVGPWALHMGHGYGLAGPFIVGVLRWPEFPSRSMQQVLPSLLSRIQLPDAVVDELKSLELNLEGFARLLHELEVASSNPFAQPMRLIESRPTFEKCKNYQVAIATHHPNGTIAMLKWLIHQISLPGDERPDPKLAVELDRLLEMAKNSIKAIGRGGVNNARIIKAAMTLGLPVQPVTDGVLTIGIGHNAQLFWSTITERTPSIGVYLAKKKSATAKFLRLHGLPTPRHVPVKNNDIELAVNAARSIGYPVVVKPDDLDGGIGVHAGLANEKQLRECFKLAARHSLNLLIEQHIEGDDYRITVVDGEVVKAIGRRPGGVMGDGFQTIHEIVASQSAAIQKQTPGRKTVELDAEALSVLEASNRSPDDVLPAGTFQALRRRANISSGGTSRDVMDVIHPDNKQLAIQAAQALKLDIAGIDLITPDIKRSWMDVKAVICEVNAQPQISTEFSEDLYVNLLSRRFSAHVHVRTVLLIDFESYTSEEEKLESVEAELVRQGETVMSVKDDGVWLDGKKAAPIQGDLFRAAQQTVMGSSATAILARLPVQTVLKNGIPWQQVDHLCLIGVPQSLMQHDSQELQKLLKLLQGHVQSPIFLCSKDFSKPLPASPSDRLELVDTISSGWPLSRRSTDWMHANTRKSA